MPNTEEPLWESTSVQNRFRYRRPAGTYFARFKVGGKPIRQRLDTAVFSVAKQRLPDKRSWQNHLRGNAAEVSVGAPLREHIPKMLFYTHALRRFDNPLRIGAASISCRIFLNGDEMRLRSH
jgi:hypothetical protein